MVRLSTTLYTANLPQENSYELLPEGKYIATVSKVELKDTKSGNGQYLNVQFTIVDGQFKGKSFFDKINISNPNQQALEIGLARLNSLLSIGGLSALEDTEQLKGITVWAVIGFAKELYQGQKQNTVFRIESPSKQQPQQAPVAQQTQAQPVQSWQQAQQPFQQQQYAPVVQPQQPIQQWQPQPPQQAPVVEQWQQAQPQQPIQQWQPQPPQQAPVAPSIQGTQAQLDDEIPF